ncbi:GGDEF domain-containing protein [Polynucleobacter sp. MWH-CaK5]|uniref:GGDEF domain-containing protein n=1 Tax=Polynucleobacter sp. MWH-CaK5 TaxID=2689107 RepID=UPI001BFEE944|nr:GGDEF domain-containing protein [Polynucleobacter sp. MWH-CaK5]QWD88449.1 GGDEF domain-containing protein [Polynucleobacter sp. MWH-CaK5]
MQTYTVLLYTLSLLLQVGASYQSFRLINIVNKYKITCIALSAALTIMIGRRVVPLINAYEYSMFDIKDAFLSVPISLLLFIGVTGIKAALGEVRKENSALEILNATDSLTLALTKKETYVRLKREISRGERSLHPLAFLMLDIDHFKRINDQYGHMVGDTVLKNLSLFCQHKLRDIDVFGRFGGEEFLIACPETDAKAAFEIAERLREAISKDYFAIVNGKEITLTVSIGISIFDPKKVHHDSLDLAMDLYIDYSDKAMYCAKNAGRNQVKLFQNDMLN